MDTRQLIATARKCGQRTTDCSGCPFNGKIDCLLTLANALADKLEERENNGAEI